MNAKQAKKLSLPDILSRLGYEPTKIVRQGFEVWYKSPFRNEKDASFHTSFLGNQWIWKDFGDTGGTVIDFVMRHENYSSVKDALEFLDRMFPGGVGEKPSGSLSSFSFQKQKIIPSSDKPDMDRQLEFLQARPLSNTLILAYLEGRGIPGSVARQHLHEVKYKNIKNGKQYFAFGMLNESGGYEIRVASNQYSFKSALIARNITIVAGNPGSKNVSVFEGMVDFLSFIVLLGAGKLSGDAIIMHSLSSFQRTADAIRSKGYDTINTFLDNNKAGQEHTAKFKDMFGEKVAVQSHFFAPHIDLNDALIASLKLDFPIPFLF